MAAKIYSTRKGLPANRLVYEVVRPQRRKLTRYKLKKQALMINDIMNDPMVNM